MCVCVCVCVIIFNDRFYVTLFSALEQTHFALLHVTLNDCLLARVFNIHRSGILTALFGCYIACATSNCCRLSARSVYIIQPCASLQCHFMQSHIHPTSCKGICVFSVKHVRLAVSCHLQFRQNDRDSSRAMQ